MKRFHSFRQWRWWRQFLSKAFHSLCTFCHFIFNISLDVRENFSISLIFILWFLVNSADVAAIVFVVCCRWRCRRLTSQSFSHLIFSYKSIVMKTSANVTLCLFWWMKQKCLVCMCGLGAWKCHVCLCYLHNYIESAFITNILFV